jgi:thiosulfate reductase cytochrome b subunit
MAGSGMRIFNAHPAFARPGEKFPLNPWEGHRFRTGSPSARGSVGARHWHFAMMWILVANGLLYLGFIYVHGEWRDLVPRRGDGTAPSR